MFDDNRIIDETVTSYKRRFDRRDSAVFQRDKPKPQYAALNNCLVSVRFSRVIRMVGLSMERRMKGGCTKWKTTKKIEATKRQKRGVREREKER